MMKNLMDFAAGSLGFYILGVQLVGAPPAFFLRVKVK